MILLKSFQSIKLKSTALGLILNLVDLCSTPNKYIKLIAMYHIIQILVWINIAKQKFTTQTTTIISLFKNNYHLTLTFHNGNNLSLTKIYIFNDEFKN